MTKKLKVIKSALLRLLNPKDYLLLELLKENKKLKVELSNQKLKYKAQQSLWLEDKLYYKQQIKEIKELRTMRVPRKLIKEFKLSTEDEIRILREANESSAMLEYDTRNLSVITRDGRVLFTLTINPEVRKEFGCPMEQELRYKRLGNARNQTK